MIQLGLIGYPLGHSLSPKIHKAALESCGLEGNYSLYLVHPDDIQGLNFLLSRVRSAEITGLNVTIPHKQNIIQWVDELTPIADSIGAVNTIFIRNGKLTGDNTDVPGFLADLKHFIGIRKSKIENRKLALVLGSGGSARAVVYALVHDGWDVTIAARRIEQAQTLITQFSNTNSRLTSIELSSTLHSLLPTTSLIVNTTPLGMSPHIEKTPWPADLPFPPNAAIYDLIYNPHETKLMKDARSAGVPASTGLGMLIEQAALSFEIWTGKNPSRDILFDAVEN